MRNARRGLCQGLCVGDHSCHFYRNSKLSLHCAHHQSPCAFIAPATFTKPAMLEPATKLGNSSSAGATYSLAVFRPLLKQSSMIPFSLLSTSSDVHLMRAEFCAISRPDTATPPAL